MVEYPTNQQKFIDQLNEIVEDYLSDSDFGVNELASEMGISRTSLHRRLKAIKQEFSSRFLRQKRLKRAMELLQLQAGTVAEIAFGVGFWSTTYFTKCFHDYYGYPPGEVKKRYDVDLYSAKYKKDLVTSESKIKSLAVLPFDNYTGDESQAFLVFGIHDALISEIGEKTSLRVVSKTSVLAYASSEKSIKEIASELGVDALVEASVLYIEEKIRIQLKLFDAFPEEQQLLVQTFDVDISNILKLYNQIIRKIAKEIQLTLTPRQEIQITIRREINPECYKACLRGKHLLYQLTENGMREGLESLHEAVRLDPTEPFAYAGLALGYLDIAHGPLNPGDAYEKAEWAAFHALKLDPDLAETQLVLAELCIYYTWEFAKGEKHFKRALELNPNFTSVPI